jgi:hypothetical protein
MFMNFQQLQLRGELQRMLVDDALVHMPTPNQPRSLHKGHYNSYRELVHMFMNFQQPQLHRELQRVVIDDSTLIL